ncbi:MAG: tRNA 2-thiouridine(34) synthase MnmA, partial [Sedimentisphaerales bacterium]|nr:tRNA 2-thiouridine(34) synthase MnmA [Sedimentisphaerales bacterium]
MTVNKWNIKLLRSSHLAWQPTKQADKQIAVLMSGGVDSSTAAYLLKQQGWDVLGITMKIPVSVIANKRTCCGADAAFVCDKLAIAHYFVDVIEAFEEIIIKPFRQSYARGLTPNPCVDCNSLLKFSRVWDFLEERFGIPYLATGHYARIYKTDGRVYLGRAKDNAKDQSYFLYGISLDKLPRLVLPLGELTKEEVRSIAAEANLPVAEKSESMELCFAGEGDYRAVLTDAVFNKPGDITDMQGSKISEHKGIANFTLGQRRGVGFAAGKPLYVGKIDAQKNTIALGTRDEVSFRIVTANQVNVLIPEELVVGGQFFGKIRSYVDSHPCKLIDVNENAMTVE